MRCVSHPIDYFNYLRNVRFIFKALHLFVGDKSGTMTVDTALDLLQAAAAEIEEESEVSKTFINSFSNTIKL